MSQNSFLEEPLDYENKKPPKSMFSIEGVLVILLILGMYVAYIQSFIVTGRSVLGGKIWWMGIHFFLLFWQLIGDLIALEKDTDSWKKTHFNGLIFLFLLNSWVLVLNSSDSEDYGFLWVLSLFIIPHGLAWAYAVACFVRKEEAVT